MEGINVFFFFCNPPAGGVRAYLVCPPLAYGDQRRLLYRGFQQCHIMEYANGPIHSASLIKIVHNLYRIRASIPTVNFRRPRSSKRRLAAPASNCRIGIGRGVRVKARLFLCTVQRRQNVKTAGDWWRNRQIPYSRISRVGRDGNSP